MTRAEEETSNPAQRLMLEVTRECIEDTRQVNFSPSAVIAEAINAIFIKPLDAAIRDGNPIRVVIRGTDTKFDGTTAGLTHPSSYTQEALIRKASPNCWYQRPFENCSGGVPRIGAYASTPLVWKDQRSWNRRLCCQLLGNAPASNGAQSEEATEFPLLSVSSATALQKMMERLQEWYAKERFNPTDPHKLWRCDESIFHIAPS
ncbi:hypothetical protein V8C34DRAFT_308235 [Trichoderma compactum]